MRHYIVPLLGVRFLILDQLFSPAEVTESQENRLGSMEHNSASTNDRFDLKDHMPAMGESIFQPLFHPKTRSLTYQLEWTAGLETVWLLFQKYPLTIGFTLGIRTPLKFWTPVPSGKQTDHSIETKSTLFNPVVHMYLSSSF